MKTPYYIEVDSSLRYTPLPMTSFVNSSISGSLKKLFFYGNLGMTLSSMVFNSVSGSEAAADTIKSIPCHSDRREESANKHISLLTINH